MFYDTDRQRLEARLRARTSADLAEKLIPLIRPTVGLRPSPGGTGLSKLGGLPNLPAEAFWPGRVVTVRLGLLDRLIFWKTPRAAPASFERPFAFVGQIDLSTLPVGHLDLPLPSQGLLLMFHDAEEFWPAGGTPTWMVMHVEPAASERPAPAGVAMKFSETPLTAEAGWIAPDVESLPDEQFSGEDRDRYSEALEEIGDGEAPPVRLGGWPWLVQSDIQEEAQHAAIARGLTGTRAVDWRLLLEVGSVSEAGMLWGDTGSLYFQMTADDLKARRWDRASCEMQCY